MLRKKWHSLILECESVSQEQQSKITMRFWFVRTALMAGTMDVTGLDVSWPCRQLDRVEKSSRNTTTNRSISRRKQQTAFEGKESCTATQK